MDMCAVSKLTGLIDTSIAATSFKSKLLHVYCDGGRIAGGIHCDTYHERVNGTFLAWNYVHFKRELEDWKAHLSESRDAGKLFVCNHPSQDPPLAAVTTTTANNKKDNKSNIFEMCTAPRSTSKRFCYLAIRCAMTSHLDTTFYQCHNRSRVVPYIVSNLPPEPTCSAPALRSARLCSTVLALPLPLSMLFLGNDRATPLFGSNGTFLDFVDCLCDLLASTSRDSSLSCNLESGCQSRSVRNGNVLACAGAATLRATYS
eukprot:4657689-Amphidinium_carterae.1